MASLGHNELKQYWTPLLEGPLVYISFMMVSIVDFCRMVLRRPLLHWACMIIRLMLLRSITAIQLAYLLITLNTTHGKLIEAEWPIYAFIIQPSLVGSDNGLLPSRRQATIWTNVEWLYALCYWVVSKLYNLRIYLLLWKLLTVKHTKPRKSSLFCL